VVYDEVVSTTVEKEIVRRSISLPAEVAEKIDSIAESRRVSANRVTVDLLSDAIEAWDNRRASFLKLADRFQKCKDPAEARRLREELARMTFGN
jgi:hypothetical protein